MELLEEAKKELEYRQEFYKNKFIPYPESTHLDLITRLVDRIEAVAQAALNRNTKQKD